MSNKSDKKTVKLSVVLATRNEEQNLGVCLESVKQIADEIIVFDEYSTDKTREVAKSYGANVFKYKHKTNFHETKQRAIDKATGDWILQLDADERVPPKLTREIKKVVSFTNNELLAKTPRGWVDTLPRGGNRRKIRLFERHQQLIERREGSLGKDTGEVVAFFVPRRNFFLGRPLIHAGVYPDGVIRLFKKGKARLPAKSVHELMEVDGEVGWLFNDLEHNESPSMYRYIERMNRYTDIRVQEFKARKISINYLQLFNYSTVKPFTVFINLYLRHKGFLDGMRGFIWSFFSAMHYPIAYFKYWTLKKNNTHPAKL